MRFTTILAALALTVPALAVPTNMTLESIVAPEGHKHVWDQEPQTIGIHNLHPCIQHCMNTHTGKINIHTITRKKFCYDKFEPTVRDWMVLKIGPCTNKNRPKTIPHSARKKPKVSDATLCDFIFASVDHISVFGKWFTDLCGITFA
ncbi:hypothetical protein H2203_001710 [Taxawa tesnikishii (nom. ined.)]|nr:hypothetical protein H2203_001710 [Dothideales sp. JES 119]